MGATHSLQPPRPLQAQRTWSIALGIAAVLLPVPLAAAVSNWLHGYFMAPHEVDSRLIDASRVHGAFGVRMTPLNPNTLVCSTFTPPDWYPRSSGLLRRLDERWGTTRVSSRVGFETFVNWFTNDWICDTRGVIEGFRSAGLDAAPRIARSPAALASTTFSEGYVVDFAGPEGEELRLVFLRTVWVLGNDFWTAWTETTMRKTAGGWEVSRYVSTTPKPVASNWSRFPNLVPLLVYLVGFPMALSSLMIYVRRYVVLNKRRLAGLCLFCAYDRKGIVGPCPECGSS